MPELGRLAGKKALVTGAGKGIGKAIALGLASEGADVMCVSRTSSQLDETVLAVEKLGSRGFAYTCDVTKKKQVQGLYKEIQDRWGGLDILFINAGGTMQRSLVSESDPKVWKDTVELNFLSVYYCAKYAVPLMTTSGDGKIIITGSGTGRRGAPEISSYACAKAATAMFVRILAAELLNEDITVNELIPGPVDTDEAARASATWHEEFRRANEWIKTPEDVVSLALFLACQPPGGPTGQTYSLMRRDT